MSTDTRIPDSSLDDVTLAAELRMERRIAAAYRAALVAHGLTPEQVTAIARRAIYQEEAR
jgi:hypothetical protein